MLYSSNMLKREHSEKKYSEIRKSENGKSENGQSVSGLASGGRSPGGPRRRSPAGTPRWHLCVEEDGQLTAVLAGSQPPVTVSGVSLASLRRQIRNAMLRGLI